MCVANVYDTPTVKKTKISKSSNLYRSSMLHYMRAAYRLYSEDVIKSTYAPHFFYGKYTICKLWVIAFTAKNIKQYSCTLVLDTYRNKTTHWNICKNLRIQHIYCYRCIRFYTSGSAIKSEYIVRRNKNQIH